VLTVALVVGLAGLTGCRGGDDGDGLGRSTTETVEFDLTGDAATVDGDVIPAAVIADTLAAFDAAPGAVPKAFGQQTLYQPGTTEPLPAIVADILTTELSVRLIGAEMARRGLTVAERARALGDTQVKAFFGDALDAQPAYRQVLVDRYAGYVTLDQALAGPAPDDAALRARYDEDPSRYDEACARHILVETAEQAASLLTRLAAGGDFAALAAAESTDTRSGEVGGSLGCQARGVFVEPFEKAVWDGPVGTVQGPVRTDFGFHVIEVTDRRARSFEQARDDVAQAMAPQPFAALQEWLAQRWREATVTVDQRFGTWDPASGKVDPVGFRSGGLDIGSVPPASR
jgi:hypothetical protein